MLLNTAAVLPPPSLPKNVQFSAAHGEAAQRSLSRVVVDREIRIFNRSSQGPFTRLDGFAAPPRIGPRADPVPQVRGRRPV